MLQNDVTGCKTYKFYKLYKFYFSAELCVYYWPYDAVAVMIIFYLVITLLSTSTSVVRRCDI